MREVIVRPRAQRQISRAIEWWHRNRHNAPGAFIEDLEQTLDLIARNAGVGVRVKTRSPGVRRVLMERVRYYVYYRVKDERTIEIVFVWHASRRDPRL